MIIKEELLKSESRDRIIQFCLNIFVIVIYYCTGIGLLRISAEKGQPMIGLAMFLILMLNIRFPQYAPQYRKVYSQICENKEEFLR